MSFVKVVNGKAVGGGEAEKDPAPSGPVGGAGAG